MNVLESVLFYLNGWFFTVSCAPPHFAWISVVPAYMPEKNSQGVCVDLSVWVWCTSLCVKACVCLCVCVCLVRMMWHGGHFCQIQHPGPCCDVKGTVKRQPQGSTGTAAPSALFPSVAHKHTHTQAHRRAHTDEHTRPSCKLTHSGGKAPPRAKKPRDCTVSSKQMLPPTCWLSVAGE